MESHYQKTWTSKTERLFTDQLISDYEKFDFDLKCLFKQFFRIGIFQNAQIYLIHKKRIMKIYLGNFKFAF